MDIKEYDKFTSAGEIVLDLFCGLLPLCLREFSEDKLTYQKNAVCDSLTTPCLTNINFCHGILPLPPFFTFWDVVKLSAGSRLTLGQSFSGHVVQTKILGKRRTCCTNQEQANGGEVGGWKRFRIFYRLCVRIQVNSSKGKRTITKGA